MRNGNSKKESKRNARNKNTITEMKDDFNGPISRPDTAEERTSEPEDIAVETSKSEKQREQRL